MVFKINISNKDGKTYKLELESEELIGKKIHDKVEGKDLNADLDGYEFELMGASDKAGFPALENVEGSQLKKVLLSYEKGMHKRPKYEGKKKRTNPRPKGLRLRKSVRGNVISEAITQINLKVVKEGGKKLCDIYADQCQPKEPKETRKVKRAKARETPKVEEKPAEEAQKEEVKVEEKPAETPKE
jgi:small subunit ribosomal protein S6e